MLTPSCLRGWATEFSRAPLNWIVRRLWRRDLPLPFQAPTPPRSSWASAVPPCRAWRFGLTVRTMRMPSKASRAATSIPPSPSASPHGQALRLEGRPRHLGTQVVAGLVAGAAPADHHLRSGRIRPDRPHGRQQLWRGTLPGGYALVPPSRKRFSRRSSSTSSRLRRWSRTGRLRPAGHRLVPDPDPPGVRSRSRTPRSTRPVRTGVALLQRRRCPRAAPDATRG